MAFMSRLVFDIETSGVPFDSLDLATQEYLLKRARTEEERALVPEHLSFSPLTGHIVAVAILNPDTNKGAVYYRAPDLESCETNDGDVAYFRVPTEAELLGRFWKAAAFYDQFITFNGRSFDVPYLMTRSAVHKIRPSKNLMANRYWDNHIDLYDRLGFFGAVPRLMSLHMWCQAFGIRSSKVNDNGIKGHEVPKFFAEGRYDEIARYCFDDIRATAELFRYWDEYLNIK